MKISKVGIFCMGLLLMMSVSCIRRPKGVASDKEAAAVIADLELAEAYLQTSPDYSDDDKRKALVDYIISKHGMSRAEFDSTMSWYGRNVDAYYDLCDLVDRELARRRGQITGQGDIEIATTDLWPYVRQAVLSRMSGSDAFEFSIPTSSVQAGQRVQLKLRINGSSNGQALLGVEYADGAKGYMSRMLSNAHRVDMTFQTDTSRVVSRIFGNILFGDAGRRPLWLDSIYLSALPFDSTEYHTTFGQRIYSDPKHRRRNKLPLSGSGAGDNDSVSSDHERAVEMSRTVNDKSRLLQNHGSVGKDASRSQSSVPGPGR